MPDLIGHPNCHAHPRISSVGARKEDFSHRRCPKQGKTPRKAKCRGEKQPKLAPTLISQKAVCPQSKICGQTIIFYTVEILYYIGDDSGLFIPERNEQNTQKRGSQCPCTHYYR